MGLDEDASHGGVGAEGGQEISGGGFIQVPGAIGRWVGRGMGASHIDAGPNLATLGRRIGGVTGNTRRPSQGMTLAICVEEGQINLSAVAMTKVRWHWTHT